MGLVRHRRGLDPRADTALAVLPPGARTTRQWTTGDPAKADGEASAWQYCGGDPVGMVDDQGTWARRAPPPERPIRAKALRFAHQRIGKPKSIVYKWSHIDCNEWCVLAVSFFYDRVGSYAFNRDKYFSGCTQLYRKAKLGTWRGLRVVTSPKPGDIILFDKKDGDRHDHAGMLLRRRTRKTIEGNTTCEDGSHADYEYIEKKTRTGRFWDGSGGDGAGKPTFIRVTK